MTQSNESDFRGLASGYATSPDLGGGWYWAAWGGGRNESGTASSRRAAETLARAARDRLVRNGQGRL